MDALEERIHRESGQISAMSEMAFRERAVGEEGRTHRRPHIPALDGLRGVAVITVFLYHYAGGTHSSNLGLRWFGFINKGGWCGVILFFVLSGFLITGILWESFGTPQWWRNFYVRRTLRIFPLYFGALLLILLGAIALGSWRQCLHNLWIPTLFLQNFPILAGRVDVRHLGSPFPIYHFWSLAVEEQFYLIWPFLLVMVRSRKAAKNLCVATFLLAALFRLVLWHVAANPESYSYMLPTHAGELALGGWLALSVRGPEWKTIVRHAPMAAVAGLLGFLASGIGSRALEAEGKYMMTIGLPCITIFAGALLSIALEPGVIARVLTLRWLRWVGGISYGIYVYHILLRSFILSITQKLVGTGNNSKVILTEFFVASGYRGCLLRFVPLV